MPFNLPTPQYLMTTDADDANRGTFRNSPSLDKKTGATSQVLTTTIDIGDVYTYTYGVDVLYRLVPSGSEQDAFYSAFSSNVLSGLIVTKGVTV